MTKGTIRIYPGIEALSKAAAELFTERALHCVASKGRFAVALSGGQSPQQTYRLLAGEPYRDRIPWQQIHVFWGDERCVPRGHPKNNARMAFDALLDYVPIPRGHIHPISSEDLPQKCADAYEKLLRDFFLDQPPRFDLTFLGLGEDGHTASLFPNTPVLDDQTRWVRDVHPVGQDMFRVSLTAHIINQGALIAFLVYGSNKSYILQQVLSGPFRTHDLPAQLIRPVEGQLLWLVDESAASDLPRNLTQSRLRLLR
jgi:6-phosphogluconolactonase